MKIKDKVAIVTGASAGIGLAVAHELAKRGAKVVLAARSGEKLNKAVSVIPGSVAMVTDMTNPKDIHALISETKKKLGRVDILVNNAGVGLMSPVEKVNIENYKAMMELNVFGLLRVMQEVIPVMREQGAGMILNVSSQVSKNYFPGLAAYASTKYALNALSLTARTELAPDGIIVSVFHPRMTATDFGANSLGAKYSSSTPRPSSGMQIDTAEAVAEKIADQIESEEAEALMGK